MGSQPAIAELDQVLKDRAFRDLAWAEALQANMRSRGLSDSGRLVAPVLRPCFLSRPQVERLTQACQRVSALIARLEATLGDRPDVMQRLGMLPAEKVLASHKCDYPRSSFTCSMEAVVHNGTVRVASIETCNPLGLGYASELADLFTDTPPVTCLRESGYAVEPLGRPSELLPSVQKLWNRGRAANPPRIAVAAAPSNAEGRFIAGLLSDGKSVARLCPPERFTYNTGILRAGNEPVDLVFRALAARDLLVQSGLSHPLLKAYRDGAACVLNSFKSEMVRRRAFFEVMTDGPEDTGTVEKHVPWTRVLARRKTSYRNQEIDLLPFAQKNRAQFVLRPAEDGCEKPTYNGAECPPAVWERALQSAAPGAWLLQEQPPSCESYPVMHYGYLQMQQLQVNIRAHVIDGQLFGAVAQLSLANAGCARPVALAPVFVIDKTL